jgi:hypothetical protein
MTALLLLNIRKRKGHDKEVKEKRFYQPDNGNEYGHFPDLQDAENLLGTPTR